MADNRNRNRAFEIYKEHDGQISLKKISEKLGVSYSSVIRWKKQDGWEKKIKPHLKKKSNIKQDAKQLKNASLTEKQKLFCLYYVRSFNCVKSYQKAFQTKYTTAATEGQKLLKNPLILEEIDNLKIARLSRELLQEEDIFQQYIDIAFADITDYVEFKTEQEPVIGPSGIIMVPDKSSKNKNTKIPLLQTVNRLYFKNSNDIDGQMISEIKEGRNGVTVKLHDKMKALQWLSDHLGILTDEQRARIEMMKSKMNGPEQEQIEDDGFIEALNNSAASDWAESPGGDADGE